MSHPSLSQMIPKPLFLESLRGQNLLRRNLVPEEAEIQQLADELSQHRKALQVLLGSPETARFDERSSVGDGLIGFGDEASHISADTSFLGAHVHTAFAQPSSTRQVQQTRLETSITQYETILTPLRRIPVEILSHIFSAVQAEPINYALPLTPEAFPWNVSRVSQRWRDATLLNSPLWGTLCVNYDVDGAGTSRSSTEQIYRPLRLALQRSRSALLDVTSCSGISENSKSLQRLSFELFIPNSFRFSRLQINAADVIPTSMLTPLRGAVPNLREIDIRTTNWGTFEHHLDVFETAPLLHIVMMWSPSPDSILLPYSQITQFCWHASRYLGRVTDISCVGLMHNLEHLDLECHRSIELQNPPFVFEKLTSLVIYSGGKYSRSPPITMKSLHVPALQSLTFTVSNTEIQHFSSFQHRSRFSLIHLKLANVYPNIGVDEWHQLFACTPALIYLRITCQEHIVKTEVDNLSQALSQPASAGEELPIPSLTTLHIREAKSEDGFDVFLNMIEKRAMETALRTMTLDVKITDPAIVGRVWPRGLLFMNGDVRIAGDTSDV